MRVAGGRSLCGTPHNAAQQSTRFFEIKAPPPGARASRDSDSEFRTPRGDCKTHRLALKIRTPNEPPHPSTQLECRRATQQWLTSRTQLFGICDKTLFRTEHENGSKQCHEFCSRSPANSDGSTGVSFNAMAAFNRVRRASV